MNIEHHFLNLGAGVQSTALYLMSIDGDEPDVPKFDAAIFADTQEEPDDVYEHLEWLERQGGASIIRTTVGRLGDALDSGTDSRGNARTDGGHYIAIPAFTVNPQNGQKGILQRQCTADYKVKPIEQLIRRIVGVEKGCSVPKNTLIHQYMGLSYDEPKSNQSQAAFFIKANQLEGLFSAVGNAVHSRRLPEVLKKKSATCRSKVCLCVLPI